MTAYDPLVLDIETAPDPAAVERLLASPPKFEPRANLRDPAKIEADLVAKRAKWLRDTTDGAGLSPLTGRVVCVGTEGNDPDEPAHAATLASHGDEEGLLRSVALRLASTSQIVTFNGWAFDAPYLRIRMLRHGVMIPGCLLPGPRYRVVPHLDLRMVLTDWDSRARGRLGDWCRLLTGAEPDDVEHPTEPRFVSGADVAALVADGSTAAWDAIADHCESDVHATWAMWQRLIGTGMLG